MHARASSKHAQCVWRGKTGLAYSLAHNELASICIIIVVIIAIVITYVMQGNMQEVRQHM